MMASFLLRSFWPLSFKDTFMDYEVLIVNGDNDHDRLWFSSIVGNISSICLDIHLWRKVERERHSFIPTSSFDSCLESTKQPSVPMLTYTLVLKLLLLFGWAGLLLFWSILFGPITVSSQIILRVHIDGCYIGKIDFQRVQVQLNMIFDLRDAFSSCQMYFSHLIKSHIDSWNSHKTKHYSSSSRNAISTFLRVLSSIIFQNTTAISQSDEPSSIERLSTFFMFFMHCLPPRILSLNFLIEHICLSSSFLDCDVVGFHWTWQLTQSEQFNSPECSQLYEISPVDVRIHEIEGILKSRFAPSALYFFILLVLPKIREDHENFDKSSTMLMSRQFMIRLDGIGFNFLGQFYIEGNKVKLIKCDSDNGCCWQANAKRILLDLFNYPHYRFGTGDFIPICTLERCEGTMIYGTQESSRCKIFANATVGKIVHLPQPVSECSECGSYVEIE